VGSAAASGPAMTGHARAVAWRMVSVALERFARWASAHYEAVARTAAAAQPG
jgi:hypothetical protein